MKKNHRKAGYKPLKEPLPPKNIPPVLDDEQRTQKNQKKAGRLTPPKKFLLVCEGETEAAYFQALYEQIGENWPNISVIPDKEKKSEGSSLKTLLGQALDEMNKEFYEEVWIVVDNDEQNAYKLDERSLAAIREWNPDIGNEIQKHQFRELCVRDDESVKTRIRYFLSRSEYECFLSQILPNIETNVLAEIINRTSKRDNLERLKNSREGLLPERTLTAKEKKNLRQIKVAYTSIAFEHWILLHFEYNRTSFYNSREHIRYFDKQAYFAPLTYNKGWFLYEHRKGLSTFFKSAYPKAWLYSLYLYGFYILPLMREQAVSCHEMNPYSTIHHLIAAFQATKIRIVHSGMALNLSEGGLLQLRIDSQPWGWRLVFVLDRTIHVRQIASIISLKRGTELEDMPCSEEHLSQGLNNPVCEAGKEVMLDFRINDKEPHIRYMLLLYWGRLVGRKDSGSTLVYFD